MGDGARRTVGLERNICAIFVGGSGTIRFHFYQGTRVRMGMGRKTKTPPHPARAS